MVREGHAGTAVMSLLATMSGIPPGLGLPNRRAIA